jgi:hypothetical protein
MYSLVTIPHGAFIMVSAYSHVYSFSFSQQYRLSQHRVHPRQKIGGLRHAKKMKFLISTNQLTLTHRLNSDSGP